MRTFKEYKGVAIFFAIITILNLIWVLNYNRPNESSHVQNESYLVDNNS